MLISTAIAVGAGSVYLGGIAAIIPNNGAENGNMNSWNAVNGFTVGQVDPASGDWHFMGGTQALSSADQTIDVPSGLHTAIDQGEKKLLVSWKQKHGGNGSTGTLEATALNGSSTPLSSPVTLTEIAPADWTTRTFEVNPLPVGTRKLKLNMKATKVGGGDNDAYFDDVSATFLSTVPTPDPNIYTDQPAYLLSVYRDTTTGSGNGIITDYQGYLQTESGFNLTTGVWTCPASGFYLFFWQGWVNINGGGIYSEVVLEYTDGTDIDRAWARQPGTVSPQHAHSSGRYRLFYFTAGQAVRLVQMRAAHHNVRWTIMGVHTDVLFQGLKETATGTRAGSHTIDSYDSKFEFTANYSNYFNTTTGEFTAPRDGAYFFWGGGSDVAYTAGDSVSSWITSISAGNTHIYRHALYKSGKQYCDMHPKSGIYYLAEGDVVRIREFQMISSKVIFGGFRIHQDSLWFSANDQDSQSTLTGANNYAGYARVDGSASMVSGFNNTTGVLTVPTAGKYFGSGDNRPVTGLSAQFNTMIMNGAWTGYGRSESNNLGTFPYWLSAHAAGGRIMGAGSTAYQYRDSGTNQDGYLNVFRVWGNDQ